MFIEQIARENELALCPWCSTRFQEQVSFRNDENIVVLQHILACAFLWQLKTTAVIVERVRPPLQAEAAALNMVFVENVDTPNLCNFRFFALNLKMRASIVNQTTSFSKQDMIMQWTLAIV